MSTVKTSPDVLVVGGGAAGIMAALFASREGARVTLLEKNEKLGRKLYITGKGRCNATNACEINDFMKNVPRNPRFLYSALHLLPPSETMRILEELGCPLKVERGSRVYPVSDKASDVTRALTAGLIKNQCTVLLNTGVQSIVTDNNSVCGVRLEDGTVMRAERVIIATGGMSYPATGSTGDGFRFAAETGHKVVPPVPTLVPLLTKETWPFELQGLSLKNVILHAEIDNRVIYHELGELLFTHFGISGPLAIELSSHIAGEDFSSLRVSIDLKPALTKEQLEVRLQKEFASSGKKMLRSVLTALLPQRMAELFPLICEINGDKNVSQINAGERDALIAHLKSLPLTICGTLPLAEAIVTRGGVDIAEISPKTMESKRIRGLYFAGELIDVDAHTGGYNLQIAFSTGALAGQNAALHVLDLKN